MSIGIIGTGKVAWQITQALHQAGNTIDFVKGLSLAKAKKLAIKVDATPLFEWKSADINATSIIIIAVTDDSITLVSKGIPKNFEGIVSHTSGAKGLKALTNKNTGIFYPLYSFPSKRKKNLSKVPFLVTSDDKEVLSILQNLASSISKNVHIIDDADRATLHLAAVFANNFTNFMMTKAFDILKSKDIDPATLMPIIAQSGRHWAKGEAEDKQTGPAIRGDKETINKHLKQLQDPDYQEFYALISKLIQKHYS